MSIYKCKSFLRTLPHGYTHASDDKQNVCCLNISVQSLPGDQKNRVKRKSFLRGRSATLPRFKALTSEAAPFAPSPSTIGLTSEETGCGSCWDRLGTFENRLASHKRMTLATRFSSDASPP
eukprot:62119-Pleurochrysis_carterae.AAC.8